MAYTPTVWKNGEFPPIDAEHLNKIEQGIANSAPAGYGLGENRTIGPLMQELTEETLDTTYNNGWYFASGVNIAGFPQAIIRVDSSGRTIYQTAYVAQKDGYVLRRCLVDTSASPPYNSFGPWEWVNPPMVTADEYSGYRTIERYKGESVFKGRLGDFEVWQYGSGVDNTKWQSTGKSVMYKIAAGATKNIALNANSTFVVSCCDNARRGVAIVQVEGHNIRSITPIVPIDSWALEAGSGLTVNVIEKDTRFDLIVYIKML